MRILKLAALTSLACGVVSAVALWSVHVTELPDQDPVAALKALNLPPKPEKPEVVIPEPERRLVTPVSLISTAVGFDRQGEPPPWETGNGFTVNAINYDAENEIVSGEEWYIVNMHTENFGAAAARLQTGPVEMLLFLEEEKIGRVVLPRKSVTEEVRSVTRPVRSGYALVVDERVPREWFKKEKNVAISRGREKLVEMFPEYFR